MLGRFLELALVTDDVAASWQGWQSLGFVPAQCGDIWSHAYGVVACEGLAIGLHAGNEEPLALVFVQPDVARLHRELDNLGVAVGQARLGSDVFNELTLREPGGMLLRVIEARTFSPPAELPEHTRLGRFLRLSLPCRDFDAATRFWERLGFAALPVEDPWEGLVIRGTPFGYHGRLAAREPALLFTERILRAAQLADPAADG